MFNLENIIERVKIILEGNIKGKVFLKDVAAAIGLEPKMLSTCKSRNSIPYEDLMKYCIKNNISASWLFYGLGHKNINKRQREFLLIEVTDHAN